MSIKPKVLVILGPTSSGKSALAVKLARQFKGSIISADSRQVYQYMNIGTAKITKTEQHNIPHYCLNIIKPSQSLSLADWQKLGKAALQKILKNNRLPIIVGGTGLYIDALINNQILPDVPPNPKLRQQLEQKSTPELFSLLSSQDQNWAATIDSHNPRRLIRALEILAAGKSLKKLSSNSPYDVLKIGPLLSNEELKSRLALRTNQMFRHGLLAEVKRLHSIHQLSWSKISSFGFIYCACADYLQGKINKAELISLINLRSRQYQKRQLTWWKRDPSIYWFKNPSQAKAFLKKFLL